MNITDLFVMILIVLTVFLGYRKNLFRNFFDFISLLLGLMVAFKNYGRFAETVEGLPGIKQLLAALKVFLGEKAGFDQDLSFTLESLQEMDFTKEYNFFFENGSFFRNQREILFSDLAIGLVTNVLAIILLFLVTTFVVRLVGSLIENSNKMAGLTSVDRAGGMIFSFLKAMIYAAVVAVVVHNIASFFNSGLLYELFHDSAFAQFFYDSGLIDRIIG